jgi:hypothetical protein
MEIAAVAVFVAVAVPVVVFWNAFVKSSICF